MKGVTVVIYYALKPKKHSKTTNRHQNVVEYILGKSRDLSNIFLIQSLLYFQRLPVTRHQCVTSWYVNYITPFPRNVSLGRLWLVKNIETKQL